MPQLPSLLLVMRHAEKPDDPRDPNLTLAGKARADKLADYISNQLTRPDFIFAAAISAQSARSEQTANPLSDATGVSINPTLANQVYAAMAANIPAGQRSQQSRGDLHEPHRDRLGLRQPWPGKAG